MVTTRLVGLVGTTLAAAAGKNEPRRYHVQPSPSFLDGKLRRFSLRSIAFIT